jgi:F-type H+-transporting ATPase subunit b
MELVKPAFGLIFWMLISFGIIFFILKKFAWKPILSMLSDRERFIQDALDSATRAKEEMAALNADNERILIQARSERDNILKEAREIKDKMIADAKDKASKEADKLVAIARENINNEKMAAITELKNQVAHLSIEIAEKILRQELKEKDKQKAVINNLLQEIKMN